MNRKILITILLVVTVLATACNGDKDVVSKDSDQNTVVVKMGEDCDTLVTAYTGIDIPKDKNLLYCSTFQLAWNELQDNMIGESIELQDNPKIAQKLNEQEFKKESLSEEDYVAMVGFGRDDIIGQINEALKEKFPKNNHTFNINLKPDSILAYAYLFKNLEFEHKFEAISRPLYFEGENVKSFGIDEIDDKDVKNQVDVLIYKDKDDFIIRLKTKSEKDELILAKVPKQETLKSTIEMVNEDIKLGLLSSSIYPKLRNNEVLIVPKMDFDITRNFPELEGQTILNDGFTDYFIDRTYQNIKFKLNEEGAKLESEAFISAVTSAMEPEESREFIFDKSFLIMLREKGQEDPYFAMWVNNPEFMERYGK